MAELYEGALRRLPSLLGVITRSLGWVALGLLTAVSFASLADIPHGLAIGDESHPVAFIAAAACWLGCWPVHRWVRRAGRVGWVSSGLTLRVVAVALVIGTSALANWETEQRLAAAEWRGVCRQLSKCVAEADSALGSQIDVPRAGGLMFEDGAAFRATEQLGPGAIFAFHDGAHRLVLHIVPLSYPCAGQHQTVATTPGGRAVCVARWADAGAVVEVLYRRGGLTYRFEVDPSQPARTAAEAADERDWGLHLVDSLRPSVFPKDLRGR